MARTRGVQPVLIVLVVAAAIVGCDEVTPTGVNSQGTAPFVSDLRLRPDSVRLSELPPDQVQDSLAELSIAIQADVKDLDGAVERVVFTIEPASSPRSTATGRLEQLSDTTYGRALLFQVPAVRDELYTVRVFAVDNDSLASNQGIGQIQFVSD